MKLIIPMFIFYALCLWFMTEQPKTLDLYSPAEMPEKIIKHGVFKQ